MQAKHSREIYKAIEYWRDRYADACEKFDHIDAAESAFDGELKIVEAAKRVVEAHEEEPFAIAELKRLIEESEEGETNNA